jgi:HlyD family secretion protein
LAKVSLTAADREKHRADKAFESKSISQIDYEKAQDDLENARLVFNLSVEQRNQVSKKQSILSIVDLFEFEIEVDILERYADNLTIGMAAEINLNGETHSAKLVTLSPEIENNRVTDRVRFAFLQKVALVNLKVYVKINA